MRPEKLRNKTRKQMADELLERMTKGPQFGAIENGITAEEYRNRYRGWVESWVLTELCILVPELRDKLDTFGYYNVPVK